MTVAIDLYPEIRGRVLVALTRVTDEVPVPTIAELVDGYGKVVQTTPIKCRRDGNDVVSDTEEIKLNGVNLSDSLGLVLRAADGTGVFSVRPIPGCVAFSIPRVLFSSGLGPLR